MRLKIVRVELDGKALKSQKPRRQRHYLSIILIRLHLGATILIRLHPGATILIRLHLGDTILGANGAGDRASHR